MFMDKAFEDKFGNLIMFGEKRWNHITSQHPEIKPYKNRIVEVLRNPDLVKKSKRKEDIFLYYRYFRDIYKGKYLLVVARTKEDPILLTCYITDRIKGGKLLWKKD